MSKTVHILGEGGVIFAMALPLSEPIEDRLLRGYLKRVNADGTPYQESAIREKPTPYASKAEWVGWSVHASQQTDSPITPDDAEALTKTDLIELYGH
ncbi:hypothetical protein [Subtercola vilae]|uniref:Uncharacterized protein n=1 Tax=Subtercola vilae TaxID=2056433 RepID=A0A4T2BPR1_9MICO|nr:hypothetical protein [Subtercola vilae]TIH33683.1 hypothetical protein D4765_14465 [Subtercola vilae]